jgi:hypothetical protein
MDLDPRIRNSEFRIRIQEANLIVDLADPEHWTQEWSLLPFAPHYS